jgi:hypothetical protein
MTKLIYKVLVFLAFVFIGSKTYAQKDLIITQAGEEIRCKILDETPTRFVYAYLGPKNKILRNEIFKNLVSSFKYSYYPSDVLKNDKLIEKAKPEQYKRTDTVRPSTAEEKPAPVAKSKETPAKKEVAANTNKDAAYATGKDNLNTKSSLEKAKSTTTESAQKNVENTQKPLENSKADTKNPKADKLAKEADSKKEEIKKEDLSPLADTEPISEFKNYLKYRIGAKGGLGNIIAKNTDTTPYGLHKEKLLRGWMFGVDAAYFFKDNFGIGATYTNYKASNSSTSLDYPNLFTGEAIKAGQLSNKVSHKFVGPTFLFRKTIDYKTFAILTLSPGMHLYTDKGLTNNSAFKFTGQAYGAAATLGLDFLLGNDIFGRDIILSLEGGYNYGQITTINNAVEKVKLPTAIILNRLDFSIGLRFTRFPMHLR